MLTREKVMQAIETMPDDSFENIDVLLERLVLWNKIERGLKDIADGNVLSNDEVEKETASWFR